MARSRYAGNKTIDGTIFAPWKNKAIENPLGPDALHGLVTVEHVVKAGERLDTIAAKYFGEAEYYWVLSVLNNIKCAFDVTTGTRIRVPVDLKAAIDRLVG